MIYKCWVVLLILGWTHLLLAQDFTLMDVAVKESSNILKNPFAGGLRAPQFSTVDLNLDGIEDMIIYDQEGDVFIPMLKNSDGSLTFDPSYRDIFPPVRTWILFRDFNEDGIKDIFCGPVKIGLPGIEVYKGVVKDGSLSFELETYPLLDFDLIYIPVGNIVTPAFVGVIDMPDIRDLDSDGDMDIIAFDPSGSTVYLYRNLVVEQGLTLDTLVYVLDQNCYGGMVESGFSQEVSLSPTPGACASSFWQEDEIIAEARHSGSTLLSMDLTGDHLHELLLGDISYDGMVALINSGTNTTAHFTDQIDRFPAEGTEPADFELFLSGFYENVDGDMSKELIIAPNERFASQNSDHIWQYDIVEQTGQAAQFTLVNKNFLVDQMVYPGPNTFPAFIDYNADGFMDLMVASSGKNMDGISINPSIYLYENIGNATAPSYELVDIDYLGMAAFKTTSALFAPALGDLDGDTDIDIVIGDNNGWLYFLENTSSDALTYIFENPVYQAFGIKVGAHARPSIFDYNQDGLADLIIGEQNFNSVDGVIGSINYFQNTGNIGSAAFESDETAEPNDPLFGRINLKENGFINNYSSPYVFANGDESYLATGSDQGFVHLYSFSPSTPKDSFELITNRFGNIREGFRTGVAFSDIDNDQYFEMAIGSARGGLAIYNTDLKVAMTTAIDDISKVNNIKVLPNPTNDFLTILLDSQSLKDTRYEIYSSSGKLVMNGVLHSNMLNVDMLSEGTYFIQVMVESLLYTSKFIKVK